MKTMLLTGATGYLGSRLGRQLLSDGYSLVAVHHSNDKQFEYDKKFKDLVTKVYLDDTSVAEIFEQNKIDGIIHTSTLYGRSGEQISDIIKANIIFPVELITNAIKNDVKFFINTDTILNKYVSPYALTKNNVTEWMKVFSDNIKMVDVKLDNFYGPKDQNTKFVASMVEKLMRNDEKIDLTEGTQTRDFIYIYDKNTTFTISGNGKQVRDVLHAEDMIKLYLSAPKHIDKARGQVFNIGGGIENSLSLLELFYFLEKELNVKLTYTQLPPRKSDQKVFVANIKKASEIFEWTPIVSKEQGIRKMLEWVIERRQNVSKR